jgi:hypothetical protein
MSHNLPLFNAPRLTQNFGREATTILTPGDTAASQQLRTHFVARLCVWFIMLSAIKFYRQLYFTAVEIKNKPLKRMLPSKAVAAKLFAPQAMP